MTRLVFVIKPCEDCLFTELNTTTMWTAGSMYTWGLSTNESHNTCLVPKVSFYSGLGHCTRTCHEICMNTGVNCSQCNDFEVEETITTWAWVGLTWTRCILDIDVLAPSWHRFYKDLVQHTKLTPTLISDTQWQLVTVKNRSTTLFCLE